MLVLISVKESNSNRIDAAASKSDSKQAKKKKVSSLSFYLGCHQKMTPTVKVGLSTSNNLKKKNIFR